MEMSLGLKEVGQREATIPWDKDVPATEVTELPADQLKEVSGGTGIIMTD